MPEQVCSLYIYDRVILFPNNHLGDCSGSERATILIINVMMQLEKVVALAHFVTKTAHTGAQRVLYDFQGIISIHGGLKVRKGGGDVIYLLSSQQLSPVLDRCIGRLTRLMVDVGTVICLVNHGRVVPYRGNSKGKLVSKSDCLRRIQSEPAIEVVAGVGNQIRYVLTSRRLRVMLENRACETRVGHSCRCVYDNNRPEGSSPGVLNYLDENKRQKKL